MSHEVGGTCNLNTTSIRIAGQKGGLRVDVSNDSGNRLFGMASGRVGDSSAFANLSF